MDIFQIVSIGIVATIIILIIKEHHPELATLVSITAGIIIFMFVIDKLSENINTITSIVSQSKVEDIYVGNVFKVVGIAYIAEFASQICKDAGEEAIAKKVELGGKIIIMNLAIPILTTLMEIITSIINNI